jgi:hypothetical protein
MTFALLAEKFPDRIKLTMPHLLTLLENRNTRKDAVALIACLAKDKTCGVIPQVSASVLTRHYPVRADLLSKMLPLIRGPQKLSWGHLLLISRLLEDGKSSLFVQDLFSQSVPLHREIEA